jgi:hypothetical protein
MLFILGVTVANGKMKYLFYPLAHHANQYLILPSVPLG